MVSELIGKIELGRTAELRFENSPYRGKNYINIRRYVDSAKFKGYTRRGVTLTPELASQLLDALQQYKQKYQTQYKDEICRLTKNETVRLIAHIVPPDENHEATCLDVREYVQSESYTGWTQKGFRLPLEKLDTVINLLQQCLSRFNVKISSGGQNSPGTNSSGPDDNINLIKEFLPNGIPAFPQDFLPDDQIIDDNDWIRLELPPEPLKFGAMRGTQQEIVSEAGFEYLANNPVEAKFIIYAHQQGNEEIYIPKDKFLTFKIVTSYEVLIKDLQKKLFQTLMRRTRHKETAETLTKKIFKENALPIVID